MQKDITMEDQKRRDPAKAKLGKVVTKAQDALKKKREAEAKRREAANQELAEFEREAATEAALNRKATREAMRKVEMSVKERLGRMVLANIRRRGGLEGSLLAASELNSWSAIQRADLDAVLAHTANAQAASPVAPGSSPPAPNVDIDLDH